MESVTHELEKEHPDEKFRAEKFKPEIMEIIWISPAGERRELTWIKRRKMAECEQ